MMTFRVLALSLAFSLTASGAAVVPWNRIELTLVAAPACADPTVPLSSCPVTAYRIYERQTDGTFKSVARITGSLWTSGDLAVGNRCYHARALNEADPALILEGPPSNVACKLIVPPQTAPGAPAMTTR